MLAGFVETAGSRHRLECGHRLGIAQVVARGEVGSLSGQNDDFHFVVPHGGRVRVVDLVEHPPVLGVALVGARQGDSGDPRHRHVVANPLEISH